MQRTKWIERKFTFNLSENELAKVLEKLNATISNLKQLVSSLSDSQLKKKVDTKWSIQEHIGHLGDLEELHEGRIDDFINRKEILRAADMSNAKTNFANHNQASIQDLINNFTKKRDNFISRLSKLDVETQKFKSLHPRLQIMMRPIDMAFFTAEHDDHHLTTIREILKTIN